MFSMGVKLMLPKVHVGGSRHHFQSKAVTSLVMSAVFFVAFLYLLIMGPRNISVVFLILFIITLLGGLNSLKKSRRYS